MQCHFTSSHSLSDSSSISLDFSFLGQVSGANIQPNIFPIASKSVGPSLILTIRCYAHPVNDKIKTVAINKFFKNIMKMFFPKNIIFNTR